MIPVRHSLSCGYNSKNNLISKFSCGLQSSLAVPTTGLYFTLNGTVYLHGATVFITDIGEFTSPTLEGVANSLLCVTSNVNHLCCRGSNGGNVGDWHFPNGTLVPRNSDNRFADFTRSGFTHQVRLNRRNNALTPAGNFSCKVPDLYGGGPHSVTVSLVESVGSIVCAIS